MTNLDRRVGDLEKRTATGGPEIVSPYTAEQREHSLQCLRDALPMIWRGFAGLPRSRKRGGEWELENGDTANET